jgi:exonuclease SbcC
MIRRIVLQDFLVHKHTEIELGEGLTVLAGPNNSGKSAVVEGLRCLASNPAPQYFIRHGAKEARVTVELEEGVRITWIRRPSYAMYEVRRPGEAEPQEYAKFGRTPPQDVLDLLRLDRVAVDDHGNDVDVHIGNQRAPIFLLDRPGTAAAAFFAASSESAYLLSMQKALKGRVQSAKQEDRLLSARLDGLAADLEAMAALPDAELAMEAAEAKLDEAEALGRMIPALEAHLASRRELQRRRELLTARSDRLERLETPPSPAPVRELARMLDSLRRLSRDAERLRGRAAGLVELRSPPELQPAAPLASQIRGRRRLEGNRRSLARRAEALAPLLPPPELEATRPMAGLMEALAAAMDRRSVLERRAGPLSGLETPPELADVDALSQRVSRLQELGGRLEVLRETSQVVSDVREPPSLQDVEELGRAVERLQALRDRRSVLQSELDDRREKLARLREQVAARLGEIELCPTCGQRLDAEAFLEREHEHGPA